MATIDPEKDASTVDLVKEALDEARELIKLEVALAKDEVESELTGARSAAIAIVVTACAGNVGLAMVLFAVASASRAEVAVGGIAALVLFAVAGGAAAFARRKMPATFLRRTRQRLAVGVRQLGDGAHGS